MAQEETSRDLISLTADVVSAFVTNNTVSATDLPSLIDQVHGALRQTTTGGQKAKEEPQKPAVPIHRSVQPDHIVCLEDGKKFKSLKRHLATEHNMTPREYRDKWNLVHDYPMVAPNYAQARSDLAKQMGLGRKAAEAKAAEQPKRGPGRPRKSA